MKHLSVPNNSGRVIQFVLGASFLTLLVIRHYGDTLSITDYILYSILTIGFFYMSLTNKIEVWVDEKYFKYQWLSMKQNKIMLNQIREIDLRRNIILIRTNKKDIKLDTFNVGKKNKIKIIEFLKTIDVPVISRF